MKRNGADRARPILKWAGGKQILAGELVRRFPSSYSTFFEPFVGGASVLLELAPRDAVVSDLNEWLLDTYQAVRSDWRSVADVLDTLRNTKEEFLRIRRIPPAELRPLERAAHLIYLNKTCFRGLFRVNRRGEFNVPYGDYDRRYYDPDNLRAFAESLRCVRMRCCDFELCVAEAGAEDFVYFDPPYFKLGGYSDFNRYTPGQFRDDDHARLAECCRDLDRRGVRWAVSNSATGFVRTLFKGFRFVELANRREINLRSSRRTVPELFITNY